jgi:hypothetical protein
MPVYLVVRNELIFPGDMHNVVSCWKTEENAEDAVKAYTIDSRHSYSVVKITPL